MQQLLDDREEEEVEAVQMGDKGGEPVNDFYFIYLFYLGNSYYEWLLLQVPSSVI